MKLHISLPAIILGCAGFSCLSRATPLYNFTLVDSFNPNYGLRETYLWDINDQGMACGYTTADSVIGYPGIVWRESAGKTIIPLSYPTAVNNQGLVVGNRGAFDVAAQQSYALPMLPGTYIGAFLSGVNDAGVAVGAIPTCNCSNSGGTFQIPYIWDAIGGARTINVPSAKGLRRINRNGIAIGWLNSSSSSDGFFVDTATGAYTLLNDVLSSTVGLAPTRAYDINDDGVVVGTRQGTGSVYFYGYSYSPLTGVQVLPFPADPYQQAVKPLGINNAGGIVGEIYLSGSAHACVFTAELGIRDLNDPALVAGIPAGYIMMSAQKINNRGWIVGYGYGGGGMYKSFVLKPVAPACSADFNSDGAVDFFDYLDFVDAFASGASTADVNHDATIDFFDYLDYVSRFAAGC